MAVTSTERTAGIRPTHRYRPRLRHWLLKAVVQKALSVLPGGRIGNSVLQQHFTGSLEINDNTFELTALSRNS